MKPAFVAHVLERAVAAVAVERVAPQPGHEQVGEAVVVVVGVADAEVVAGALHPRLLRHVLELPVAEVVVEPVPVARVALVERRHLRAVREVHVEQAVVVVVDERRAGHHRLGLVAVGRAARVGDEADAVVLDELELDRVVGWCRRLCQRAGGERSRREQEQGGHLSGHKEKGSAPCKGAHPDPQGSTPAGSPQRWPTGLPRAGPSAPRRGLLPVARLYSGEGAGPGQSGLGGGVNEAGRGETRPHGVGGTGEALDMRFHSLVDGLPIGVMLVDALGRIEYVNPRCAEFLGRELRGDLESAEVESVVHPEDVERTISAWLAARSGDRPFEVEGVRLRRHDGSFRSHLGRGFPLRDAAAPGDALGPVRHRPATGRTTLRRTPAKASCCTRTPSWRCSATSCATRSGRSATPRRSWA